MAIIGIRTAIHYIQQTIAIGIFLAQKARVALLGPGQAKAAILAGQIVKFVQGGRKNVKLEQLAKIDMVGAGGSADVAFWKDVDKRRRRWQEPRRGDGQALLGRHSKSLREIEWQRPVQAGFFQQYAFCGGYRRRIVIGAFTIPRNRYPRPTHAPSRHLFVQIGLLSL